MNAVVVVLLAVYIRWETMAIPIDNSIVGQPVIECEPRGLRLTLRTKRRFGGQLFARGFRDECRGTVGSDDDSIATIALPMDACGVHKLRSLNPPGLLASVVVTVSFHKTFITKVDRVYRISCFFMEAVKSVSQELEASMLTTQLLTVQAVMPTCRYEVLQGGPTGPPLRQAIVGQQAYHKWTCVDVGQPGIFCAVVHSCYVEDGISEDSRVQLLDKDGCTTDRYLLGNLEYTSDLMAGKEAHVFKYADRVHVHFQCEISIFTKEPNQQCNVFHPKCDTLVSKRRKRLSEAVPVVDVSSEMQVLDSVAYNSADFPTTNLSTSSLEKSEISSYCLDTFVATALLLSLPCISCFILLLKRLL